MKRTRVRPATGTCLESSISEGRGVVATVLVQDGTLKVGDAMVCGDAFGTVRALHNDLGQPIQEAGPSTPVEISGLGHGAHRRREVRRDRRYQPGARNRRDAAEPNARRIAERAATLPSLSRTFSPSSRQQKVKTLNLILKADVQGSLEALVKELDKLENPEVPVRILVQGCGWNLGERHSAGRRQPGDRRRASALRLRIGRSRWRKKKILTFVGTTSFIRSPTR